MTALDLQVVVSEKTTRATIECASLISESEHCLPVKIHDAHLFELAAKVDLILVPRCFSSLPGHIACPKLGALPDCAIAQFGEKAAFVSIDINEKRWPLTASLRKLGEKLGAPRKMVAEAAHNAVTRLRDRQRLAAAAEAAPRVEGKRILLLGHPYNLDDDYMSGPVVRKLQSLKAAFAKVDHGRRDIENGPVKWDACSVMHDTLTRLEPAQWAGVIQLSSFNCGCDSVVMEFFRVILKDKGIPYMRLVLDEYDGKAGLDTRLEAFVDSIRW